MDLGLTRVDHGLTCMTMSRSMTRMKDARKERDASLVATNASFSVSQLIQSATTGSASTGSVATSGSTARRAAREGLSDVEQRAGFSQNTCQLTGFHGTDRLLWY